jgi:tRNA(adenine34) deaminase
MEMDDESFMQEALSEARRAGEKGDVPVGAVAVRAGQIIGRGHNRKEELKDPTAHAEMLALREAARVLGGWRLVGVTLYCTMEPCPMCAGAMVQARLPRLVYAVDDPKAGAAGSVLDLLRDERLNHQVKVVRGVLAEEVGALLESFFETLREGAGVDDRGGLENRCGGDSTVGSNPTPPA